MGIDDREMRNEQAANRQALPSSGGGGGGFLLLFLFFSLFKATAQKPVQLSKVNRQKTFRHTVPPGNYSGITPIGGDRYAVVSDKAPELGFFLFHVSVDTITGKLREVVCEGFVQSTSGIEASDLEAITFVPDRQTIFLADEATTISEYTLDGQPTGRSLPLQMYGKLNKNYGLESLTYNAKTHRFWTCNEAAPIRLQAFDEQLQPVATYTYPLDTPKAAHRKAASKRRKSELAQRFPGESRLSKARNYAHGVSELLALPDGSLLVLEREFYVPKRKVGAWVINKLYQYFPDSEATKHLVAQWKTHLNLTRRSLANYEGMCLGPRLADGRQVIILVSDSQNQYAGILRDYFKTIVIERDAKDRNSNNRELAK